LSDYGEAGDDIARCDENAVLRPTRYQFREIVPLDGKALDDAQQVECLEVIGGWFALRASLGWQLAIEIREEP
jgi:hypothetical protein